MTDANQLNDNAAPSRSNLSPVMGFITFCLFLVLVTAAAIGSIWLGGTAYENAHRSERTATMATLIELDGVDLANKLREAGFYTNSIATVDGTDLAIVSYDETRAVCKLEGNSISDCSWLKNRGSRGNFYGPR